MLILQPPGTKNGPCKLPCKHIDCAQARADAEKICPICGLKIGYGAWFDDDDGVLSHIECSEDEQENDHAT